MTHRCSCCLPAPRFLMPCVAGGLCRWKASKDMPPPLRRNVATGRLRDGTLRLMRAKVLWHQDRRGGCERPESSRRGAKACVIAKEGPRNTAATSVMPTNAVRTSSRKRMRLSQHWRTLACRSRNLRRVLAGLLLQTLGTEAVIVFGRESSAGRTRERNGVAPAAVPRTRERPIAGGAPLTANDRRT